MYDAVLMIAFGGPTQPADIRPFLANVSRGRSIPAERLEVVAHHYELIGGRSPLNELTFRQARALEAALADSGTRLRVYVGMRNWTPYLAETLAAMRADGVRRAVGVIMSPHQSEASWGRYQHDVAVTRERVAGAPDVDYAEPWPTHPLFIAAVADRLRAALAQVDTTARDEVPVVFTAHSIPTAMAARSGYAEQVAASARLVADAVGVQRWQVAYQSRSGNPRDAWLEPDIGAVIGAAAQHGDRAVVVVPVGLVCDHVEVLYDLDIAARQAADAAGMQYVRAATVNDHPLFIQMLADVVQRQVHLASI